VTDLTDAGTTVDQARRELLRRRLTERGLASSATPAAVAPDELSDGQRRMWFVQQADPSGALLNISVSYRITGVVDLARLHEAVEAVAHRHTALRTTYRADEFGEPHPTVHEALSPGWTVHDLSTLADPSTQAQRLRLEVLAQREFAAPFDLSTDAPLRITVIRTAPTELVMLLVAAPSWVRRHRRSPNPPPTRPPTCGTGAP
jgi:mycobactin peptide synthetase MbtE